MEHSDQYEVGMLAAMEIAMGLYACHTCGRIETECPCEFEVVIGNGPKEPDRDQIVQAIAQGIEARRAATGTGAVHESAVRQDAPKTSPLSPKGIQ